jgi:hypothetical protein
MNNTITVKEAGLVELCKSRHYIIEQISKTKNTEEYERLNKLLADTDKLINNYLDK